MELVGRQVHMDTGTAVTIGNFDGFHLGHQKLLSELKKRANESKLKTLVYTFSQHPAEVLKGGLPVITSREEKSCLLESSGVDMLHFADFMLVKDLEPEAFVKSVLIDRLQMKMAVIGENNRFGKNSRGDATFLLKMGEKYGFPVYIVKSLVLDGVVCSSTEIRNRIQHGDVLGAANLLGRPFSVSGTVIGGKHLGRTYGFPTANLAPAPSQLLPKPGVYATNAYVNDCVYPAITNVGETSFDETKIFRIETNLLDFNEDLYEKHLKIEFLRYMRDIEYFSSTEELKQQLIQDRENRYKETEATL